MKNNILLFVVVCASLACSANLMAKERRGAELVIQQRDGQQLRGELIAVKQDTLLLLSSEGADVSVDIDHIKDITIEKKSKFLQGAAVGIVIGGGAGAVFGVLSYNIIYIDLDKAGYAALFGGIGAVLGLVIGGLIGDAKGRDETIQLEGKSDTEIKSLLEKLRRQARVPGAQ